MIDDREQFVNIIKDNLPEIINKISPSSSKREKGHSSADKIQDMVIDVLKNNGVSVKEDEKIRGMNDCKISHFNINYPTNIKSGMEKFGQPNMVSMNRMVSLVLGDGFKDGYNILKIKFFNGFNTDGVSVIMFNLLDVVDYLEYNMGTGQIMLKEEAFYKIYRNMKVIPKTYGDGVKKELYYLFDRKAKKHIDDKQNQQIKIKNAFVKAGIPV